MMKVAVNRRALEINKRISDTKLHHPPIIVKDELGNISEHYTFNLRDWKNWRIVYRPETPWIEILDGDPIAFNVWIEGFDD
jgi:hypothetical protein